MAEFAVLDRKNHAVRVQLEQRHTLVCRDPVVPYATEARRLTLPQYRNKVVTDLCFPFASMRFYKLSGDTAH